MLRHQIPTSPSYTILNHEPLSLSRGGIISNKSKYSYCVNLKIDFDDNKILSKNGTKHVYQG